MPISRFKATCLAALERVRRTGQPLRVTRFGKPIADIVPPALDAPGRRTLGTMAGSMEIVGDLVAPLDVDWEATRR
jgi:antitoxin (DNA-binding transcriptional repressor) of toxin-antitoxin stability system